MVGGSNPLRVTLRGKLQLTKKSLMIYLFLILIGISSLLHKLKRTAIFTDIPIKQHNRVEYLLD